MVGACRSTGSFGATYAVKSVSAPGRLIASYAVGVWGGLTLWAALAQYVLPTGGHALGKLGSFCWVLLINAFPALLCACGFVMGLVVVRPRPPAGVADWRVALLLGLLFPLTVLALKPVFAQLGKGLGPALVWCVVGSAIAGGLLRWWERQDVASR